MSVTPLPPIHSNAICLHCRLNPILCICAKVDAFFSTLPPGVLKNVIKKYAPRNRK